MSKRKHITQEEKQTALRMAAEGKNCHEIARSLGRSKSAMHRIVTGVDRTAEYEATRVRSKTVYTPPPAVHTPDLSAGQE